MLTIARSALASALFGLAATTVHAEFAAGPYHDAQCMRCHDTSVYTREDRRVRNYPALEAQVARCDANLATKLFPDDLSLLVEHLNTQYYRFAK
ncbi:MAG: cytochrome c [Gammaproteobacteria bacterium]|nr:cytochrome c [Gammaproteobacteria bacterium]MCP5316659.1 cytochrome c [Chromatiaceae bacterium]MCW5584653.1 cytochrome c [Chromatiales bacterium]MCB1819286.1 cytochrome c [Gammaproteobacteria bacterium]MCP5429627.1 cytochrome c [Chromatiaceae bacterium]